MKKLFTLLVAMVLMVAQVSLADTISIDLETATDQEITDAIYQLQAEKITRAKVSIPPTQPSEQGEYLFRSIPWYSTRTEAETILGVSSSSKGPNDIYRMSALDFDSVTNGSDRVDDYGGCKAYYTGVTVAGLTPSSTYMCYIYPIVNGQIIQDDSLAQFYFGYYKFSRGDFGDYQGIYDELKRKLNTTYGNGVESGNKYHTVTKWTDSKGNYIQLLINDDCNYVALGYIAADADQRLDEMQTAISNRMAEQERIKLQEQEDNYGGL